MSTDIYIMICVMLTLLFIYGFTTVRNAWSRLHYHDRATERGHLLLTLTPGVIGMALLTLGLLDVSQGVSSDPVGHWTAVLAVAAALLAGQGALAFWVDTATWYAVWKPRK